MLHGEVQVNGLTIGEWSITRSEIPDKETGPDDLVTYNCVVKQSATLNGAPAVDETFVVSHRYGDGAIKLIAKALQSAHDRATMRNYPPGTPRHLRV